MLLALFHFPKNHRISENFKITDISNDCNKNIGDDENIVYGNNSNTIDNLYNQLDSVYVLQVKNNFC